MWFFTRYTALSAKFVFNLSKLSPNILCYHKFKTHCFLLKMVTYVQNKLIKVTFIVDISIIGFNAHCMLQRVSKALFIRTLRWKDAVHSLPAWHVFHNPD